MPLNAHIDDVQSLVDRGLGVEGETGIDLSGDLARDDFENLLAEFDEETVQSGIDLLVDGLALFSPYIISIACSTTGMNLSGRRVGKYERAPCHMKRQCR